MTFALFITILFTFLKLFGAITWSWWLVFLPIYLPFVTLIVMMICFIILVMYGVAFNVSKK